MYLFGEAGWLVERGFFMWGVRGGGRREGRGGILLVKLDVLVRKKMLRRAQLATKPLFGC